MNVVNVLVVVNPREDLVYLLEFDDQLVVDLRLDTVRVQPFGALRRQIQQVLRLLLLVVYVVYNLFELSAESVGSVDNVGGSHGGGTERPVPRLLVVLQLSLRVLLYLVNRCHQLLSRNLNRVH